MQDSPRQRKRSLPRSWLLPPTVPSCVKKVKCSRNVQELLRYLTRRYPLWERRETSNQWLGQRPRCSTAGSTNGGRGTRLHISLFPVQAYASVPFGISGVDSPMQVTVTNLTSTNQAGSLTISITDSTGNAITNFSESFSVGGSDSTNLEFALPGSLPAGSYSVTGSLSVNGGTGQVLAGTYVLPAPPIMLAPASTTPFTSNGFSMALQGPAGNYLIEASSDISNPTNWQPILFYSSTNSPFYYYFTDPTATNFNQQFYRAVTQ
jgi:hypothetical protein